MRRRASDLAARARERIRAAREQDPHAWPERENDRGPLHDDEPIDFVVVPDDESWTDERPAGEREDRAPGGTSDGATRPPLGSPEPGAPDLDTGVGPGGVSGPPRGGRPLRPGERERRLRGGRPRAPGGPRGGGRRPGPGNGGRRWGGARRGARGAGAPAGLRIAASWSWRLIVVLVALYVLLYAAAYVAVVVVPVIVALLLAALLQPGAAGLVRRGWPRPLAAFTMLVVGLAVVAGIITLVVERFSAGFNDLAGQVSEGIVQVQTFVVRTFPITRRQLESAVAQVQDTLVNNQDN